ncbi:hypothetical protein PM10SUCC1_03410 [Propionigenium maris DSM 9537]|uniref:DUF4325 domain-containing protein n=1 Tax=Propionigenium maris DSM 9537 TaxID=1123000 RepID=A0A9W6LL10_9FUSO|nr:DUF4325 domain-containing protein [Propionigenium maris]GLI54826.1 hypothetical protein PM10SUCC1_03410 [Propionigenium maris DSM 9537]
MVIVMEEERSLSQIQEKLLKAMRENRIVTLDFAGMMNIEEEFLKDLFATYPKSMDFLKKIRIQNANSIIVHSLKMVVNSIDRKKK